LSRWRHIECDESQVKWRDTVSLRGLERLPLRITPAAMA